MKKTNISLVSAGNLKWHINFTFLEKWQSKIIEIQNGDSIGQIPDAEGENWTYPDSQLNKIITPNVQADFTVALINAQIENNYYMRRLDNNIVVLSLFEMIEIIRSSNFNIEHYILRNLYELTVLYIGNGNKIPSTSYTWTHDEVRGCLFDINPIKEDIVYSMHQPKLCHSCRNRLLEKQVDTHFLPALDKELSKLKKSLYFRIVAWVKNHPILALLLTAFSGVFINVIASFIFEMIKNEPR